MPEIQPSIAIELNKLHELAIGTARQAVSYAKQAGELLLQVKEKLPHGKFGPWCETNTSLSERTCQRYMAVALGKEVHLRALAGKTDNVAVLPRSLSEEEIDSLVDGTWVAKWKPKAGHWYTTMTDNGAYWVVPDLKRPDQFHVSRLYSDDIEDEESLFSGTRWAESADRVEITLRGFLLSAPEKAVWKEFKRAGLTEPFGAPDNHGKIKVVGKDGQERWIRYAS
jgi:Protein of unknown function (DUF3102)